MFAKLKHISLLVLVSVLVLATTNCGWDHVKYEAQPSSLTSSPEATIVKLIRTGRGYQPMKVERGDGYLSLLYAGARGVTAITLAFDAIAEVKILQRGSRFLVDVHDEANKRVFRYHPHGLSQAQAFADALEALRTQGAQKAKPSVTL